MIRSIIYLILILSLTLIGCSNKPNKSRKPVTRIEILSNNKLIKYGQNIEFQFVSIVKNGSIENLKVLFDGALIADTNITSLTIRIDTKNYLPGKHSIQTVCTKKDGIKGTNYYSFLILSDTIPTELNYEILNVFDHNTSYFTQGFEFYDNWLYESTGNYGTSSILKYKHQTGIVNKSVNIEDKYFGEGITILDNKIYQLTYKSRKGFVYDLNTFELINEFTFKSKEGWGLTNNGVNLIMSDGTSKVYYIDPITFKIVKTIEVTSDKDVVNNINELEYLNHKIYANVWQSNYIIVFEASTGRVLNYISFNNLLSDMYNTRVDVLNGIAYNQTEEAFYITGKLWPKIFKVKFK